ncbi:hypothetical protein ACSQ67_025834 [Phaseolus vulgaris]
MGSLEEQSHLEMFEYEDAKVSGASTKVFAKRASIMVFPLMTTDMMKIKTCQWRASSVCGEEEDSQDDNGKQVEAEEDEHSLEELFGVI